MFAFESLKKLQQEGHQIILWTYRCGPKLKEAVDFCESKGIKFYAVNKSYPEEVYEEKISRKILADFFIDDRNINGLPPWGEIYHQLSNSEVKTGLEPKKKKGLLKIFKSLK